MLKRLFSAVFLAVFLTQQVFAASFSVANDNDDTNPGSLRTAIINSNAAGGTNTISWASTNGGTISLGSNLPGINGSTTLDVTNAASAVTIGGPSAMSLAGGVTFNNAGATPWAISAAINGGGSLNFTGTGTLNLTGANTYSGGTTVNGGLLKINAGAALGNAGSLLTFNGGGLQTQAGITDSRDILFNVIGASIDTQGFNSTLSGSLRGSGGLIKLGSGTLFLTGPNNYGEGTYLNAGTLNLNVNTGLGTGSVYFNAGTLQFSGPTMTIQNNFILNTAAVFDNQGDSVTLAGMIGGAGSLVEVGTGTVYLTQVNGYSGGTTVNGGILNVPFDAALGGGAVTLNGGTLQAGGILISTRNVTLGAGGGTIDTNSYNISLSGVIGGTSGGALTKVNSGMLTLNGLSTYNGATNVRAGTLQLGVSQALPASTVLTVFNGAVFDMQGYTQTVAGYVGGGATNMVLQKGVTNLTVNGNANLSGGTLSVSLANPLASKGDTFTIVKTNGGVVSGTFLSITPPAAIKLTPDYSSGNSVVLTVSLVPFSASALTGNQISIGNALEPLRASPTGDRATILGNLYALAAGQLRSALDQIGPTSLTAMGSLGSAAASIQGAAVSRRMEALADGSAPKGYSTFSMSRPSLYPGTLIAEAGASDAPIHYEAGDENSPWGFFTSGLGTVGRINELNVTGGAIPGFSFNTAGFAAGADYRIDDHWAAGGSAGYLYGHSSVYAPGSGTMDDRSLRFGLYMVGFNDQAHVDLYLGGAEDFFTTNRGIQFGSLARTATASPQGTELNIHPSAGYDFRTAESGTVSPFAALNYDRLMIGSFSENGAGDLNLSVGPQTDDSLQSTLGLRYSFVIPGNDHLWTPYASLGWRHEFISQNRTLNAQLADGGVPFSVQTGNYAQDGTVTGLGASARLGEATTAKFDYAGDFRSHFQDSSFNLSLRTRF